MRPMSILSRTLLPTPDAPMTVIVSPRWISRLRSLKIIFGPKRFFAPMNWIKSPCAEPAIVVSLGLGGFDSHEAHFDSAISAPSVPSKRADRARMRAKTSRKPPHVGAQAGHGSAPNPQPHPP